MTKIYKHQVEQREVEYEIVYFGGISYALDNIPIYEHPMLYRARMTMDRNRAVVRRLKHRRMHTYVKKNAVNCRG